MKKKTHKNDKSMSLDTLDIEKFNKEQFKFNNIGELENYNLSKVTTDMQFLGDKYVIGQIVQLLSYIRNAVNNKTQMTIEVKIGNTIANPDLMMQVNGFEVPDLTAQNSIQIN